MSFGPWAIPNDPRIDENVRSLSDSEVAALLLANDFDEVDEGEFIDDEEDE